MIGSTIAVDLTVFTVRDRNHFIAYAPALEVYGYSDLDAVTATQEFERAVKFFIEYHTERDNLFSELVRLGWERREHSVSPPVKYEIPANLMRPEMNIKNIPVNMPAFAN